MKSIFTATFCLLYLCSIAQIKSDYQNDLTELRKILSKTPGYKTQIKGKALEKYNQLFSRLKDKNPENNYEYFYNLAQLYFPLKDNHLGFYQTFDENHYKDEKSYSNYFNSSAFPRGKKYNINIDSLENELKNKSQETVEGIYNLTNNFVVGLFKIREKEYVGLVLSSDIKVYGTYSVWERGEAAIHLLETEKDVFKAIYMDPIYKFYTLYNNEKFRNYSLINSAFYGEFFEFRYNKLPYNLPYINLPKNRPEFEFKKLNEDVSYIHIKNFEYMRRQASKKFLDSVKTQLITPNLIFDLRNNEGGSNEIAKHYVNAIKKFSKTGNTYVLVNNGTISQGEIVTSKIRKFKNVKIVGQTTRGTLAYGSNYGTRKKLPGKGFVLYLTDMNENPDLLPFENTGIKPDIFLDEKKDWVDAVLQLLNPK